MRIARLAGGILGATAGAPTAPENLTPNDFSAGVGRLFFLTANQGTTGDPSVTQWVDQFNAIAFTVLGVGRTAPQLTQVGDNAALEFTGTAYLGTASAALNQYWANDGTVLIGGIFRPNAIPASAAAFMIDGGQFRVNPGGWVVHLLANGHIRLLHETAEGGAWSIESSITMVAEIAIAFHIIWDGDVTASNAEIFLFDPSDETFKVDPAPTISTAPANTLGNDSAGLTGVGAESESTPNVFNGECMAVWGAFDVQDQAGVTVNQITESFARDWLSEFPDQGGSGIATPRVGVSTFRQAADVTCDVGYITNVSASYTDLALYKANAAAQFHFMADGNVQKPLTWLNGSGVGSASANGQGFGSVNDVIAYIEARGYLETKMTWHGMLMTFQQSAFITGASAANFQSRVSTMFAQAQAIAPDALRNRVDVVNELLSPFDAGNYGRRLFKGGFPFTNGGSSVTYLRQVFTNARAQMPNARLAFLEIGHGNNNQYGLVTTANQVGTAGSVASARMTLAQMAIIKDIIDSQGAVVDIMGGQFHFRQGDYFDFLAVQTYAAEMGQRGIAWEYTEVDLAKRGAAGQAGGGGGLGLTDSATKFAKALRTSYNANPLSNELTFWENGPKGGNPAELFTINHDYVLSSEPQFTNQVTGALADWHAIVRDQGLAQFWHPSDRPNKGIWGRRLNDRWIIDQAGAGAGFVPTGTFGLSTANLNGTLSTDGQFDPRTGLKLLANRSLHVPFSFMPNVTGSSFTLFLEVKREGVGNGAPVALLDAGGGNSIAVEVDNDRLRLRITNLGQVTTAAINQVFANNDERRCVLSVDSTGITAAVAGVVQTLAPPASGMPVPVRLFMGGNTTGSAVSNWRLNFASTHQGIRTQAILSNIAQRPWGSPHSAAFLDPDCTAALAPDTGFALL